MTTNRINQVTTFPFLAYHGKGFVGIVINVLTGGKFLVKEKIQISLCISNLEYKTS